MTTHRPTPPQGARNLVLLVLDSCRFDSFMAAKPKVMSRLGEVQRRFSYASWTSPAHYNLMLGLLPHPSPTGIFASDYYREELGVKTDRRYVTSGGLWRFWDYTRKQPDQRGASKAPANTAVDLAYTMVQNPHMRVLVQQGYYDLATPYGATDYFIDQMDVPDHIRSNLVTEYYEAGHMMYLHPESLAKYKRDLAVFITK